jgi:hypothetical protein
MTPANMGNVIRSSSMDPSLRRDDDIQHAACFLRDDDSPSTHLSSRRLLRRDGVESDPHPWIPAFGEDDERAARMTKKDGEDAGVPCVYDDNALPGTTNLP